MKQKLQCLKWGLLCVSLLLFACKSPIDEHYAVPEWLKGSAWEVLEKEGNFTTFLHGVELAGFRPMVEGKSILTIMAPNDTAFETYLLARGYASIDEMSKEEVQKLIGFHLLYYSYNKEKLINFRPAGDRESEESKVGNAGLYYKFRTHSQDVPTIAHNNVTNSDVAVYHFERFIPVFSHKMFETKNINPKINYEYFYPNSTWNDSAGFNVADASVNEYERSADNGYIYIVDRVIEPLETVYNVLRSNAKYSEFFKLYDNYSTYILDDELTSKYKNAFGVDALYRHTHGDVLPPIAQEWHETSFLSLATLAFHTYNIFAPSDDAMNDFYARYWQAGGYTSLTDVDRTIMQYFIWQFFHSGNVVFPDEIRLGKILNRYGYPFNFDTDATSDRKICVNGTFYGLNEFPTPQIMESVVGPGFKYKNLAAYFHTIMMSGNLESYVSANTNFITLVPTNDQLAVNAIRIMDTYFENGGRGTILVEENTDGELVQVSQTHAAEIADLHTNDAATELVTEGTAVYTTKIPFNYWFVKNGTITNNTRFNKIIEPTYTGGSPFVPFTEVTNEGESWNNGKAYTFNSSEGIFVQETNNILEYNLAINADNNYPYYEFVRLLKMANMVSGQTIPLISPANGRFVAFIPTNEVLRQAWIDKKLPGLENCNSVLDWDDSGIDKDIVKLAEYLANYFVRSSNNVMTNFPYIGSSFRSGDYNSAAAEGKLEYKDTGNSLNVRIKGSSNSPANVVSTYDYFPFVYTDGCFHLIDAVL